MKNQQGTAERADADDGLLFSSTRRHLALAGVAAVAVTAGAVVGWRELQPSAPGRESFDQFWRMDFDAPDSKKVEIATLRGKPLLVNFWATWCPPCVEELPMLEAFFQAHVAQGWQVLGLAVDQPGAVQRFLERMPLSFPIALAGLQGTALSRALGNEAGGLPFSVVFNAGGRIAHHRMGRLSAEDLRHWTDDAGG